MPDEIRHRTGVYAWLRWSETTSAFLPVPEEDAGKSERVAGMTEYIPLSLGMLGILSGGLEDDETYEYAVRRELLEERGLHSLATITNTLPPTTVGQLRNEKRVSFDVHGHIIYVDEPLRHGLLQQTPVIEIPDDGLERFLTNEKKALRPFVYQIGMKLVQSGMIHRL